MELEPGSWPRSTSASAVASGLGAASSLGSIWAGLAAWPTNSYGNEAIAFIRAPAIVLAGLLAPLGLGVRVWPGQRSRAT